MNMPGMYKARQIFIVFSLAVLLLLSGCEQRPSTPSSMLEAMLPVGTFNAELLDFEISRRATELAGKMRLATSKDPVWFQRYLIENVKPGEPLPYHPKLGLTEAEHEELLSFADGSGKLYVKGQIKMTIKKQGSKYEISVPGPAPSLGSVSIDPNELVVQTEYGRLSAPKWNSSDGSSGLLGAWEGFVWYVEEGSFQGGDAKSIKFNLYLLSSGKTFLRLKALVMEKDEVSARKDISLRFKSAF